MCAGLACAMAEAEHPKGQSLCMPQMRPRCSCKHCAALQIEVSPNRVLSLAALRGTTRPVLIAGSRNQLQKALRAAEPFREQLRERGVSVIQLQQGEGSDTGEKLKALKNEIRWCSCADLSKGFCLRCSLTGESKPVPAVMQKVWRKREKGLWARPCPQQAGQAEDSF